MICRNCGTQCMDGTLYCVNCGAPLQDHPPAYYACPQPPAHGFALTSMILGIGSFFIMPIVTGILAICFGASAKKKGNRESMATAGIVCGSIGLALWILMIILLVVLISSGIFEVIFEEAFNDLYSQYIRF
ncbi:MAG: DUF4190 domain-containing protein [Ruminococcaceae bacterium]|nr:DUF4190 domain-containing protein [Oscillospiraceae bacterium]